MTPPILLAIALLAAPPASRAKALAAKKDADALLMEFGAVTPADYKDADRKAVALALVQGAQASRDDLNVAVALAEKAAQLDRTAPHLTLLAQLELGLELRGDAASHFEAALSLAPAFPEALLGRGDLAMEEHDYAVALAMFQRATQAHVPGAGDKLLQASAGWTKSREAMAADLRQRAAEPPTIQMPAAPARDVPAAPLDAGSIVASEELSRVESDHFVFTYSESLTRRGGGMFSFEGDVEKSLETTYAFVSSKLGYERPVKTKVVLMDKNEYAEKHKGTGQANAGGYWNGKEIVVNCGLKIDRDFTVTMIHEFTHTVAGDLSGGKLPRWMNEGIAENVRLAYVGKKGIEDPRPVLSWLKRKNQLPSVRELDGRLDLLRRDVGLAYAESTLAVAVLLEAHDYDGFTAALGHLKTQSLEAMLQSDYGLTLDALDEAMTDAL
ncbi:MAG: hypothetical protein JST54_28460 [Deltaproteobacteria bacterium]|nr:hypothetical protein [Deltaproteobacteria bacterium]